MPKEYETPFLAAVSIMAYRQVKSFLRRRTRVFVSFMRPLVWLFFFSVGWAYSLRGQSAEAALRGLSIMEFMAPGVAMMSVFFTSFFAGASVIWDREFGFLKETFVAPAPRSAVIFGRVLGDSAIAVFQGFLTLALAIPLVGKLDPWGIPLAALAMTLSAIVYACLGSAIGSSVGSMEAFELVQTTVAMPMMFLSGTVVPLYGAPPWMRAASLCIPLAYGVDAVRSSLTGVGLIPLWTNLIVLCALTPIFVLLAVMTFERAAAS